METGVRSGSDHLSHLQRLEETPEKVHFFHAMRVLEAAFPDHPRMGSARRPKEDPVRHGQEAELRFPPSTLAEYLPPKHNRPATLTNRFFGLFGANGPLPLHLTEYVRSRVRNHRDPTMLAFANMLTHRLTTLFYRAWRSGEPAPSFDRGDNDQIERKVASISGYNGDHLRNADAFPDLAKRHFSGLLAQGAKNAEGLQSILRGFFGTTVTVEEFVGCWLYLEAGDRWQLGTPAQLGQTTSIGDRVWIRSAKFRLRIGPLGYEEYKRLLPGQESLKRLRSLVRNYVGDALDWDVNLILRGDEVPEPRLGSTVQLGRTSWIGERDKTRDAADLYLEPNTQIGPTTTSGGT